MKFVYAQEQDLSVDDYCATLAETDLRELRPLNNYKRIKAMLDGSNFIVTARDGSGAIVGLARCITDNAWVCYCAELAVRESHQGQGIGRKLLETCEHLLGPGIAITLLAEPDAVRFYERAGLDSKPGFAKPRSDRS